MQKKGGDKMHGFGRGFGFSPPWSYIGRGRGGLSRCWHPGSWEVLCHRYPTITKEEELNILKEQADLLREELNQLEARIKELESEK